MATVSVSPTVQSFYNCFLKFIDEIHKIIIKYHAAGKTTIDPHMISMGKIYIQSIPANNMVINFITSSYSHWNQIKTQNENFFLKNISSLIDSSLHHHLQGFTDLFRQNILDDTDKNKLWDCIISMVEISILFIHEARAPIWVNDSKSYREKIFTGRIFKVEQKKPDKTTEIVEVKETHIRLAKWAHRFEVELLWPEQK